MPGARGVGADVASALLVAAGDNPERLRTEASFAALCGSRPVEASSGKVTRTGSTGAGTEKPTTPCGALLVRLTCDPGAPWSQPITLAQLTPRPFCVSA